MAVTSSGTSCRAKGRKRPLVGGQDFRAQCDEAVARDRATREHVRKLEQEYDATASEEQSPLPGEELDSDRLMQELQDFLRKQRGGS